MRRPAYLSQPIISRLPNLLREIQEGEIRIPRFQRPFIWTTEQRLLLLRSIYEGMPIGSILIWRTREHDLKTYDRLGPLLLGSLSMEKEREEVRQYVLDGHQRLTTLFVALGRGLQTTAHVAAEFPDVAEEPIDADWMIFFDLTEQSFVAGTRRSEPPLQWLPLTLLFDPFQLYEFQKKLVGAGLDRVLVNRAESLASTFKDYSIPVVPIVTEDLEVATQSFQRVNSGGTPMNEVHMVSALTWTPEFDLNERMKEILMELGEVGWQALEEKMILNTCKAALDLDIYYADVREIGDAIKDRPQILREATDSLRAAAGFLRERCNVYGPAVLPYSFQIVLMADAIRMATDGLRRELDSGAAYVLESWFWLTTYTEYFAGISAVRLAKALKHIRALAEKGGDPKPPGMSREARPLRRFDFRSARSRAISLRMAALQPRGLSGSAWNPYELLANHGPDAMPMLLSSREVPSRLAEGSENRFLAHPTEATRLRRSLKESSGLFFDNNLWESHAINAQAVEALQRGDSIEFLRHRREALLEMERAYVENLGLIYSLA